MIRNYAVSKLTSKSQTVIPQAVRRKLGLQPGDSIRYRMDETGIHIEKLAAAVQDDPFASFSEWASEADDKAYRDL